jgi:hypothetical protein
VLLLVENLPESRIASYACLSHCWGSGADILKTLTSNLQLHLKTGIKVASLPKTFKDAIKICQRLSIVYLWIDSLCIIQDSDSDWRIQAASMAGIYANAYLTIAAASANDPSQGCFRKTHWSCIGQPLPGYPGVYVRREPVPPTTSQKAGWPLLDRGWVFQELSLSPRIIFFGEEEVAWQCQTSRRRECQSDVEWSVMEGVMSSNSFGDALKRIPQLQWYAIVEAYAWRTLTFAKDRLPAIAAMATLTQKVRTGDRYIAGLWRSSLCFDLLWYTNTSVGSLYRSDAVMPRIRSFSEPDAHRLPSWSWASTSKGVLWHTDSANIILSCVEILDIAYTIHGPDILGNIQGAVITIRAPLYDFGNLHRDDWDLTEHTFGPQIKSDGTCAFYCRIIHFDDVGKGDPYGQDRFGRTLLHRLFILHLSVNTESTECRVQRALVLWQRKT